MICGMWELKKKLSSSVFWLRTEKSSSYHFFTIWHFNNYNWHFYFIYWIELLNYCPRFSRVKDFTASCHMIYWPPGCSFPSYLSWRFLNAPSRLKTLGSIKSIHFQGLSFSSSESPDLQEVLCCSPSHFHLQMMSHPLQDPKPEPQPEGHSCKEIKECTVNVFHNGCFKCTFNEIFM